ncbi:DNA-binding transcriptional ArsR family regulator [Streptacidiphilus sp. MAP12-33]|uniref:DUF742 domain-containing protein n=1 Tax=Streptacidiphilus sp. MAP12-33 TaxID=3156266 RepID=UPI00351991A9
MRGEQDGFADDDGASFDGFADEEELGQLVRPYTLTRGRTRHAAAEAFDLVTQISAAPRDPGTTDEESQDPEHEAILDLVRARPLSVAEIAADLDLPLGVVRILLGDLLDAELIHLTRPVPAAQLPDESILREVIKALRAL